MPSKDPRTYVRVMPLPSSKLRAPSVIARTAIHDDMYKSNYDRRHEQITSQGFWSVNHKPYRGIGDPFYLDEEKLILHSLGQWDEDEDLIRSSSSDEDEMQQSPSQRPVPSMTAAKFLLRRNKKGLNTLKGDVAKSRNLIRNVRLGYGFFDLIRQQRQAKSDAEKEEKKKKFEAARNEWQPPKSDSDSESDVDDNLENDIDIDRLSTSSAKVPPRPYTPQHTNLSVTSPDVQTEALFRQLCVLNWILEAMNIEHGSEMSPITQSWVMKESEIGGSKHQPKTRSERSDKLKWEQIVSNTPIGKFQVMLHMTKFLSLVKKASVFKGRPMMGRRPTCLGTRMSISPGTRLSISPTSSSHSSSHLLYQEKSYTGNKNSSESTIEEEGAGYSKGMFSFLDEYYESLRKDSLRQEDITPGTDSRTPQKSDVKRKETRMLDSEGRKSKKSKTPERTSTDADDSNNNKHRGRKLQSEYRANHTIRPKSTAALLEYQAQLPSNKHKLMTQLMRQKFNEVFQDKCLTLHDILEQIERERLLKCKNKFMSMDPTGHNFHKDIRLMRLGSDEVITRLTAEQLKKKTSFGGTWYTDLISSIPAELKKKWFYQKILHKLGNYGLPKTRRKSVKVQITQVENSCKQSVYKFLKVLETIREWEICSPDISAAIEFCREKIVEMTVDEFEEWFCQQFPKILRPQTAPPCHKSRRAESQKGSAKPVHVPVIQLLES